ncbi:MAG: FTR1 family protein [Actinobacteria bacterium]|nr:FTR1 family protein [Actinomycetota bacterium]
MSAFLIMLREGLEAALVVGILLAYLHRVQQRREARWVWAGTLSAAGLSAVAGIAVYATIGSLGERAEEIAEGAVALVAAGLLTWMIFWMGSQSRHLRARLEARAGSAVATGSALGLAAIAFFAVLREGLESALFLISTTVGTDADGWLFLGGMLGLALAIGMGNLIYRSASRIDIRLFFRITGTLILLFAAGLVAKGIHAFQEVGVLPTLLDPVWDVGVLHPDTSLLGRFAGSLFGWRPDPSLLMVAGYLAYLLPIGATFFGMTAGRPAPADEAAPERVPVR